MKMGPNYIICSCVCFYRRITIKSENWRALITVGLPGRTRVLEWEIGGESGMRNDPRVGECHGGSLDELWRRMKGKRHGESLASGRGLGRVKRIDVAAGRRCVIYFPSLPRRGRTLNRRGVPRALYAPMNQSYTTTTVFHSRTTLGRAAKILRKSQAMINHADASYKWNRIK